MEELKQRYIQLLRGYKRLDYAAQEFKKVVQVKGPHKSDHEGKDEESELVLHRDSLIKRFEILYELVWKFFKSLLRYKFLIEVANPRATFEECHRQSLLTAEETKKLLTIIRARNETIHIYDEELANEMSDKILDYNEFFSRLINKISSVMQDLKYL